MNVHEFFAEVGLASAMAFMTFYSKSMIPDTGIRISVLNFFNILQQIHNPGYGNQNRCFKYLVFHRVSAIISALSVIRVRVH